jgi:non-specific serine/threonine protein kinase
VRRRLERGCELLAASLREREREADANTAHGHNVPRPLTRLIGRETELGAIRALLAEHRLVVLTGPGGIGKSRLALHLAHDLAPDYPDGAWFVEMATVVDDRQVPQAVLTALGQREIPGRSHTDTVTAILAAQRPLLVVDNCEQVVAGCSSLLGHLLQRCRDLQVLATSREALHVAGAAHWSVPPLALPATDQAPSAGSLMHFDAPRLFNARAAVATPGFEMTDDNAAQVGDICARLDGIPLALELAAGRLRQLTLAQLDTRLADRFAVLRDGRHATRPSHETLRAMMDWSYDLLTAPEQQLYRRLAVFRGGCTLEAAEGVCSGDGVAADDVLELLDHLEAKSLLYVRDEAGARRFRMLETVREYALDRLTGADEVSRWRDRHLAHFEAIAIDLAPCIFEPQRMENAPWVAAELDNFRAAMAWAAESHAEAAGARIASTLLPQWEKWGLEIEVEDWLSRFLAAADDGWPPTVHADALYASALIYTRRGNLDVAVEKTGSGRALYEAAINTVGSAACDVALAQIFRQRGRGGEAIELILSAQEVFEAVGHRNGVADAKSILGVMAGSGSPEEQMERLAESEALYHDLGYESGVARVRNNRGYVYMVHSQYAEARVHFEAALEIWRRTGDTYRLGIVLLNLGGIANGMADFAAARQYLEESLQMARKCGDSIGVGYSLAALSGVAYAEYDDDLAHRWVEQAVAIGREIDDAQFERNAVIQLISLELFQSRLDEARVHLVGAFQRLEESSSRNAGLRAALLSLSGRLQMLDGQYETARESLSQSIRISHEMRHFERLAEGLECFAELASKEHLALSALVMSGSATGQKAAAGTGSSARRLAEHAAVLAPMRAALGDAAADQAHAIGRQATSDEAVAYALGELTWDGLRDAVEARVSEADVPEH